MANARNPQQSAQALIYGIKQAFEAGIEHFDASGAKLSDVREVLIALRRDGRIELKSPRKASYVRHEGMLP